MLSNRSFLRDERELVDMPGLGKGKKERKKEANIARQRVLSLTVADKLLLSRFDTRLIAMVSIAVSVNTWRWMTIKRKQMAV